MLHLETKEPKQRFASVQEFAIALQQTAQGTTSPPSTLLSTPAPKAESTTAFPTLPAAGMPEGSSAEMGLLWRVDNQYIL